MKNYSIYTIGYTGFNEQDFIHTLLKYEIGCVVDVRSYPVASEFYQIYSKCNLEPLLKSYKILYRNYAKEFGARQENRRYYMPQGCVDFEKFTSGPEFTEGVQKIKKGIDLNYNFVLMCAEKDPINCHRAIMISRGMTKMGFTVKHILANSTIEKQDELDKRLLDSYHMQPSFLQTTEQQIAEAYRRKNIEIGFTGDYND